MRRPILVRYVTANQAWYEDILENHREEADAKVEEVLRETTRDDNGCMVTDTTTPRKLRFKGGQDRAYRFVYCVRNRVALARDQVVRHCCSNRRCVNPRHLIEGDQADNVRDEWDRQANGVDYALL